MGLVLGAEACGLYFLLQLHHHIWNLNILLRLILCSNLEDDILLVLGNRLLADVFHQLAHPVS